MCSDNGMVRIMLVCKVVNGTKCRSKCYGDTRLVGHDRMV